MSLLRSREKFFESKTYKCATTNGVKSNSVITAFGSFLVLSPKEQTYE